MDALGVTNLMEYNVNGVFGTQQAPNSFMLENQVSFFAQKITVTDRECSLERAA